MSAIKATSALISVYNKDGLEPIVHRMNKLGITIFSTGGTQEFIESLGVEVVPVEQLTGYPSILGGRVKTLHPMVFGGILNRRGHVNDEDEMSRYKIPQIDIVIVDLYPFQDTVAAGGTHDQIIEKIDIGGIALIRAAAKNYTDTLCVSSMRDYEPLLDILQESDGESTLEQRKAFSARGFDTSSHYDAAIYAYMSGGAGSLKLSESQVMPLRYGENPHQAGWFYGDFKALFHKLNGKDLSYNNLLDVEAALKLMGEFQGDRPTFAIFKHNNACGVAQRDSIKDAYTAALAGDPVSAFGGILIANRKIDMACAEEIHKLFCEVVIAPGYDEGAQEMLCSKPNRIILELNPKAYDTITSTRKVEVRSALNGYLAQQPDHHTDSDEDLNTITKRAPSDNEVKDLLFASKICKHTKSNTIVLAKNAQLCASGTGQTSRVDALQQAIHKAKSFDMDLNGAVMASDAFFPFPDCVEIAYNAGVAAVIQPGGSIKDQLSIDFCDDHDMAMVFTGVRHFKH